MENKNTDKHEILEIIEAKALGEGNIEKVILDLAKRILNLGADFKTPQEFAAFLCGISTGIEVLHIGNQENGEKVAKKMIDLALDICNKAMEQFKKEQMKSTKQNDDLH